GAMKAFLDRQEVLLKDFAGYVTKVTAAVKSHAQQAAAEARQPYVYLADTHTRTAGQSKEERARQIMARDNIVAGLICVLAAVEPCSSFDIYRNKDTKHLEVVRRRRKWLYFYYYLVHPQLGFCHVRIQSWFPFEIQVWVNGSGVGPDRRRLRIGRHHVRPPQPRPPRTPPPRSGPNLRHPRSDPPGCADGARRRLPHRLRPAGVVVAHRIAPGGPYSNGPFFGPCAPRCSLRMTRRATHPGCRKQMMPMAPRSRPDKQTTEDNERSRPEADRIRSDSPNRISPNLPPTPPSILGLQRSIGNRAVVEMIRRQTKVVEDTARTPHLLWGGATVNTEAVTDAQPILIEVMEYNAESAKNKVNKLAAQQQQPPQQPRQIPPIGIMVMLNQKADAKHIHEKSETEADLKPTATLQNYNSLVTGATALANYMDQQHVPGGCFPAVWGPTDPGGGYTFPFLEARGRVTLHRGTEALFGSLSDQGLPIIRSMDADVTSDPLLEGTIDHTALQEKFSGGKTVVSGGYSWNPSPPPNKFWNTTRAEDRTVWNGKFVTTMTLINDREHAWRKYLKDNFGSGILYWPEPNTYMTWNDRLEGAGVMINEVTGQHRAQTSQQRENIYSLKNLNNSKSGIMGEYEPALQTIKPIKSYFDGWGRIIEGASAQLPSDTDISNFITSIRQSHFSPNHLGDIQKWYGSKTLQSETDAAKIERLRQRAVAALTKNLATILHAAPFNGNG
ncbi:MAG: hypothetical protein ACRDZ8_03035, partial [Acidimicrobiales bacterium]